MPFDFRTPALAAAAAIGLAQGAQAATAGLIDPEISVDWGSATRISIGGGDDDPLVIFGFNPQPEPPAMSPFAGVSETVGATEATRTAVGVEAPQRFVLFLAGRGPGGGVFAAPSAPADDFSELVVGFDTGFDTLEIVLDFSTSSGGIGDGIDALFFNPQPEPPALFGEVGDVFGLEFAFTSLSDASVSLSVRDSSGATLGLAPAPVPVPATLPLIAGALAALGAVAGRRR
jgi:hypothetical protein